MRREGGKRYTVRLAFTLTIVKVGAKGEFHRTVSAAIYSDKLERERQNCLKGCSLSQIIDFLFVRQFNGCPFVSVLTVD